MAKSKKDPVREARIENEIVVDAYGPQEQAIGWYCYLESNLSTHFEPAASSPTWCRRSKKEKSSKPAAWQRKTLLVRHARIGPLAGPQLGAPVVSTGRP